MIVRALKRARNLIADGWSEPFTLDVQGRCCSPRDEGVQTVTVQDALILIDAFPGGWNAIESVVSPEWAAWNQFASANPDLPTAAEVARFAELARAAVGKLDLQCWLEAPGRKLTEVLRAFDVAILRAAREVH